MKSDLFIKRGRKKVFLTENEAEEIYRAVEKGNLPKSVAFKYGYTESADMRDALLEEFGCSASAFGLIVGLAEDMPEGCVVFS